MVGGGYLAYKGYQALKAKPTSDASNPPASADTHEPLGGAPRDAAQQSPTAAAAATTQQETLQETFGDTEAEGREEPGEVESDNESGEGNPQAESEE